MTGSELEKQATTKFSDLAGTIFRPEEFVSRKGGYAVSVCVGAVVAVTLWRWSSYGPLGQISCSLVFSLTAFIVWFVGREAYLRSGSGRRLGICYIGHRVDRADWKELKHVLDQLFKDSPAARRISIRHIPASFVLTKTVWQKKQNRYRFEAILKVTQSPTTDGKIPLFDAELQPTFKGNLNQDFQRQARGLMQGLFQASADVPQLLKKIRFQAESFFNTILFFVSIQEFAEARFDDASRCFSYLDSRLAGDKLPIDNELRKGIRWLDAMSLMSENSFAPDAMPVAEALLHAKENATAAVQKYGKEFPIILNALPRTLFFCGENQRGRESFKNKDSRPLFDSPRKQKATIARGLLGVEFKLKVAI